MREPEPQSEPRGFAPSSRIEGLWRAHGSKSYAQRALLAAALSRGPETRTLAGVPGGADVEHARACLVRLGLDVGRDGERVLIAGRAAPAPGARLEVGESATLARLLTGVAALALPAGSEVLIAPSGSLRGRSSPALFEALGRAGVRVDAEPGPGSWPARLWSRPPPGELILERPGSSQELSALLLACAAQEGERVVQVRGDLPSEPYVALTVDLLESFGANISRGPGEGGERFRVRGPLWAPPGGYAIEPDASSAAVALAAACLSGGRLRVPGLDGASRQGDVRVVEHLCAFGCNADSTAGGLVAGGRPTRGARLDLAGQPDLAPVLAIVAAGAALRGGVAADSLLTGLGTLPGKESDRLAVLAGGLRRAGFEVRAGADSLAIGRRSAAPPAALVLDSAGDHRMAFAWALLGLILPGVLVAQPGCVAKSWPRFWWDLEQLGALPA